MSTQSCADLQAVDNSTTSNTNATSALLATSLPFTVPDGTAALGGSVAVRVQLRETAGGPVNDLPVAFPCAYGSYGSNDRDDLVVQVGLGWGWGGDCGVVCVGLWARASEEGSGRQHTPEYAETQNRKPGVVALAFIRVPCPSCRCL